MNNDRAPEIISALASGVDRITGEVFCAGSTLKLGMLANES